MDCKDCLRVLPDYLDETLCRELWGEIEEHLASCRSCKSELLLLRKIDDTLRTQGLTRPPADFTERLLQRLPLTERPARVSLPWNSLWPIGWGVLIAGFGALLFRFRVTISETGEQLSLNLTEKLQSAIAAIFGWLGGFSPPPFPSISPQVVMAINLTTCTLIVAWSLWLVARAWRVLRE